MTPATTIPPPAWCHMCRRVTPTVYLPLSSGHVGNLCGVCRCARLGRPYVPKSMLTTPRPAEGRGCIHETAS